MSSQKKKPTLIKNPTYQEYAPLKWVKDNVIDACPYDGPEKHEQEFRRQVNLFFWHILQFSLYPKKKLKHERFGSVWVPFHNKFGQRELPMVFGSRNTIRGPVGKYAEENNKNFSRALDWLMENVFNVKGYKKATATVEGKCREFRIRREILDQMYPQKIKSSAEILNLTRYYSPIKIVQERYGRTIMEMLNAAVNKPFGPRRHDLSVIDRNTDRKANELYRTVLNKLGPNPINLDDVLTYLEDRSLRKTQRARNQFQQVLNGLFAILSGPVQIVSEQPLVISYYPAYTLADISSKLFEQGGGFQNFPAALKQKCSMGGTNWDMESSQLRVLKTEFAKYGIECSFLASVNTVNDIADAMGLPKKLIKNCLYATIFSANTLAKNPKSRVVKKLLPHFKNVSEVYHFIEMWNINALSLIVALNKLADEYTKDLRKSGPDRTLKCDTGVRYVIKDFTKLSERLRRKMLSHRISGMEARYLLDALKNDCVLEILSIEHDGALLKISGNTLPSPDATFIEKKFSDSPDFLDEE